MPIPPKVPAVLAAWPTMSPDLAAEQLPERMGIEITDWNRDRMVATMPVAGNRQPLGLLHGGANAVLAETLGSTAAALYSLPARVPVGLEVTCSHHRAATTGLVTAVCTPLSVGRTIATFEIVISDEDGRRTCTARLTCVLRDHLPAQPADPSADHGVVGAPGDQPAPKTP